MKIRFCSLILALLLFSAAPSAAPKPLRVGFDLDDTLVFSTPAFSYAYRKGGTGTGASFWALVNSYPLSKQLIKRKAVALLRAHQRKQAKIFIITARRPAGKQPVVAFVSTNFNIPPAHIHFEPRGKTRRMRRLRLDIFYGDSDSDIRDAQTAGVRGIRILRSPRSSYKRNYNPGKFGEPIVKGSEE